MKNRVFLHNENGVTQLKVNGTEIFGVSDYKITMSATGKTEMTFTITADSVATELENDLLIKVSGEVFESALKRQ